LSGAPYLYTVTERQNGNAHMWTGSFFNHLYGDRTKGHAPEIGMGATILGWTDRSACTIIEVSKSGKLIRVQKDIATRTDGLGMTDAQQYTYEADPNGYTRTFTLRKNGAWVGKGETMKGGTKCLVGARMEYYDYSF
jgi:hypothetical protein